MRGFQAFASWTILQQGFIVRLEDLLCWSGIAHGTLSAAMTKHTACETQWNALRNTVKRALRCETHSETHSETQHKML